MEFYEFSNSSRRNVAAMSTPQLRRFLQDRGIDGSGLTEREDLLRRGTRIPRQGHQSHRYPKIYFLHFVILHNFEL